MYITLTFLVAFSTPISKRLSFFQSLSLHRHQCLAHSHLTELITRCLAVTGGGSIGEYSRLSQLYWLEGHYNIVIHSCLLTSQWNDICTELMWEPVLQDKRQEHIRFCKYATELIELVSGKPPHTTVDPSLERIRRVCEHGDWCVISVTIKRSQFQNSGMVGESHKSGNFGLLQLKLYRDFRSEIIFVLIFILIQKIKNFCSRSCSHS